ncbi:MAG: BlaI/MecI/CopY family transcriptional regulator [Clostridium sp.]|nr:BlaI/MecI/CopY family transcriptional regulator [Clostridium sp.]
MQIKISDAELEIMRILWRVERPMKASELSAELEQTRGWAKSTTNTLVIRLRDRGLIEPTQRYGVARYIPLVTQDQYILSEEKSTLNRFGSAKTLAMAMVRNGDLTQEDIAELHAYFKMGGGK